MSLESSSITVVVPYHNEGDLVVRAVESVRAQDYAGRLEIIVVDDASTEPAANHLRPTPDLLILRNATSLRASGSRNLGIEKATGKYICFLDADDVYLPGRLSPHVDFLENHPEVGVVGSGHLVSRGNKTWEHALPVIRRVCGCLPVDPTVLPPSFADDAFLAYPFHTGAFTARTEAVRAVGGFNTRYSWGEEWDLLLRLAERYRVAYVPGVVYHYIAREGSICRTDSADKFRRMAWLYRDWLARRPLPREHRNFLCAQRQRTLGLASQFYLEVEGNTFAAWKCACEAVLCGPSWWGLRSLIRTSLHLPLALLKTLRPNGSVLSSMHSASQPAPMPMDV